MMGRETVDGAEREVLHASSEVSEQDLRMLGESWGIMILMLKHYLHISLSGLVPVEPDLQLRYQQSRVRQ